MSADITMTPTEASKLFEEKIETLREKRNQADLESRSAVEQRDKTRAEVVTLQQEKDQLIDGNAELRVEVERIKATLAEHRANVEASLAKQEAEASGKIQQAAEATEAAKAEAARNRQFKAQLEGVRQTFLAELSGIVADVSALVQKTTDALNTLSR